MVKHVILWNLKEEFTDTQKEEIKNNAKANLEGLLGQIDGLVNIKLHIKPLDSSTADMMLDSTFKSVKALKSYSIHPKHVAVADKFVRPYTAVRSCIDYEI